MVGQHTLHEIMSQADAWADALSQFQNRREALAASWRSLQPREVIFTGCGSTHYLSQTAAWLLQALTGVPARGVPASELVFFGEQMAPHPQQTLLVAVSRSGTTSETQVAMQRFRELGGAAIWGITCYPESPVGAASDLMLPAVAAQEKSIAQTRSFSSMLLLAQAMAATVAGQESSVLWALPDHARALLDATAPLTEALGSHGGLRQIFFLGSGPQVGVANEAMLKMKEMSISHSEAYHFMEFRHGPKSMVDAQSLVVALLGEAAFEHERAVLDEVAALGATTLALAPAYRAIDATHVVRLPAELPWWAYPVLYLPTLQLLAYHRAVSRGLDPDSPRHLDAVVTLDVDTLTGPR